MHKTQSSEFSSLVGRNCWVISDGKTGVETQLFSIAEQLQLQVALKRVAPSGFWRYLAPYGPPEPATAFGQLHSDFAPPWPDVALAGGRMTVPYIRALRRHAGASTYTVFLQDPRTGPNTADLIWVPQHDRRRGGNVFTTLTTPHHLTRDRLTERRRVMPAFLQQHPGPRVAVLTGGNSRSHKFTDDDQLRFVKSLESLAEHAGSCFVTASRRTPPTLVAKLQEFMARRPGFMWDNTGENPLHDFVAHADILVVTADSANMVCEVCVTGRPVYVFHPSGGSKKFDRLHRSLEQYGATRVLPDRLDRLETWSYQPLSATETIATEIETRWRQSHIDQ